MTVKQALLRGWQQLKKSKIDSAITDAEILLLEAVRRRKNAKLSGKIWLYAYPEYRLSKKQTAKFLRSIKRRSAGEPLAYITGHREFFGLDFYVNKNVLVPRPETEILVEKVLETAKEKNWDTKKTMLTDIGTGSGCIPLSLAKRQKWQKICATDISPKALLIAQENARRHKMEKRLILLNGSLLEPAILFCLAEKPERIAITANLPYVKSSDIKKLPIGVKMYEPLLALDGGRSGSKLIFKLLEEIKTLRDKTKQKPRNGTPDIDLFLEIAPGQKTAVIRKIAGYFPKAAAESIKDLSGKDRLITVAIPGSF